VATIGALLLLSFEPSLVVTTILFMCCFAGLGAGNGALFQLVPLRWPLATAIAGSMIGEIGACGGSLIPNVMGQSKQLSGSFAIGFLVFAVMTLFVLIILMFIQRRWTQSWIGKREL
jgi:NNP family nitrate/nitrite transporter-like MFS transporter